MLVIYRIHDTEKILVDALGTLKILEYVLLYVLNAAKSWVPPGTEFEFGA
jgi:hypothetical protein